MSSLEQRVAELSDEHRRLLHNRLSHRAAAGDEDRRSLAAVVMAASPNDVDPASLRMWLSQRLPDFMVPAEIRIVEGLPRLPNGKVDRKAVQKLPTTRALESAAPPEKTTAEEELLIDIWSDLLGTDAIRVDDNFFELGGDSIVSIQMVSRAREQGLQISVRQIADHPTIRELSRCGVATEAEDGPDADFSGRIPLSPIQRWFFDMRLVAPEHWNHVWLFRLPPDIEMELLRQAVQECIDRHHALRACFERDGDEWGQRIVEPDEARFRLQRLELDSSVEPDPTLLIDTAVSQVGFDLRTPPLLAAVQLVTNDSTYLCLIAHHLVVDNVSWSLLLPEVEAHYLRLQSPDQRRSRPVQTAFADWVDRLTRWADSDEATQQVEFWSSTNAQPSLKLPTADFGGTVDEEHSGEIVVVSLSPEATTALLTEANTAYSTRVQDLLVAAMSMSLQAWLGNGHIRMGFEGHGRESFDGRLDVSETIGWMTSFYTLTLELSDDNSPDRAIKAIKELFRAVPHGGIGFGVLRYLCRDPDVTERMAAISAPEILFNYGGSARVFRSSVIDPFDGIDQNSRDGRNARSHALEVNALIDSGTFSARFSYGTRTFARSTIESLADDFVSSIERIVDYCLTPGVGGVTPSDFAESGMNQAQLDSLLDDLD